MTNDCADIQPVTIDVIRSLHGTERTVALMKYHQWVAKNRKDERAQARKEINRINNFIARKKNPELFYAKSKVWHERHKIRNVNQDIRKLKNKRKKSPDDPKEIGRLLRRRRKYELKLAELLIERDRIKMGGVKHGKDNDVGIPVVLRVLDEWDTRI